MEDFSVVVIARNEEKTLPRLIKSLKGVDDIVIMDTGSTDKTVEVARSLGARVEEVGDRFRKKATEEDRKKWERLFGSEPPFEVGKGYFHFADARNHAATLAKNDWVFMPDADEVPEWDLEKVLEEIQDCDQLVYRFCFAHNPDKSCALEFTHCKFYRRSKLHWIKWVHEIVVAIPGKAPKPPKYVECIYHHHWQNKETNRGNYLPGLALSLVADPDDDRNLYYMAREFMYVERYEEAINLFKKSIEVGKWAPEVGQAWIFMGDCYLGLKKEKEAKQAYCSSLGECSTRREPFWALMKLYVDQEKWKEAIAMGEAAISVPFQAHGYLNDKNLYGWVIYDKLAFCYGKVGDTENSRRCWELAVKNDLPRGLVEAGLNFFFKDLPPVSIVVPTVRPEGFNRLAASIEKNTIYPEYEIVEMAGEEGTAISKFNDGVRKSTGEFVVYLADDTEVTEGWLIKAYLCWKRNFRDNGLVIFNDEHWNGAMANHFLCNRSIKDLLDGNIWHPGYNHCGVDVELYERLNNIGLVEFCEEARIVHHHYFAPSKGASKDKEDKYTDIVNKYMKVDRMYLSERMRRLGLTVAADKYDKWFESFYGEPVMSKRKKLAGDLDGPERTVVLDIDVLPMYEARRYQWAADNKEEGLVLDLGCSSGFGCTYFAPEDYIGVDRDEKIIDLAREQFSQVTFVCEDIHEFLDPDAFYENIIIFECLEHLEDGKEVAQMLKKHCNRIFATVPYKESVGAWGKYHKIHNLTEKDFPGFEYKWMHPNGMIYNHPKKDGFNLMYLSWKSDMC